MTSRQAVKRFFGVVCAACFVLSGASAYGEERGVPFTTAPERAAPAALGEADIALLLDYLNAALRALAAGREPPSPPAALGDRVRELASEFRARGALAAMLAIAAIEEQTRALLRELPPPRRHPLPPTVPYTPVSSN